MKHPHNIPTSALVFSVFKEHPNEWLTTNDIAGIIKEATPSEIGGYVRILCATVDGFERIVTSSHKRMYRYTGGVSA